MFRTFALTFTILSSLSFNALAAWTVQDSSKGNVQSIKDASDIFAQMRIENVPNDMVYALNAPDRALIRVYDLIACLHLTNPKAEMEVDHGGGYEIKLDVVEFPGGTWDVEIRLREDEQINKLDKYPVYILDRFIIGTLRLRDLDQRVQALRQMSSACYANP